MRYAVVHRAVLLVLIVWVGMSRDGFSQVVNVKVSLQVSRLTQEEQSLLRELPEKIQNYVNNFSWANTQQDIQINFRINFVIEAIGTQVAEKIYRGQLLTTSSSGENILDKALDFPYQSGGNGWMQQSNIFHPLRSLIDYYVYMVIAGELDAYLLKGGTKFYNQARSIAAQGKGSRYTRGWEERLDAVEQILDGDHAVLREAKYYYYEGLFYAEKRQDSLRTPLYAKKVIELLDKIAVRRPDSYALKRFLDAHHQEFCTLLSFDKNTHNAERLLSIDSRHRQSYQKCLEK